MIYYFYTSLQKEGAFLSKEMFNSHVPSYVGVYNTLYSDIMNDLYPQGHILPSESALAEKYNVSRNTVRQALAVLNEDGLIIKSQGKGTIVAQRKDAILPQKIFNPLRQCAVNSIDSIEMHYNFNPATDIAQEKLNLNPSDIVLASNNLYKIASQTIGYSFVQIPISFFPQYQIDAQNEDQIHQLIDQKIFDFASTATFSLKLIQANEIEQEFLKVKPKASLILMEEILYLSKTNPLARCKFYLCPEYYKLQFQI